MDRNFFGNKIIAMFGAILCCALWGISTPIVKMGYPYLDATHVPSLFLWAGLQFAIAGIFTIGSCSIASKRFVFPSRKGVKGVLIVSLLQTVLQYSLLYIGLSNTSSVKGAVLKSTDVFFVVLIAGLLFKTEKLTLKKLVSCGIGFLGIVIMNLNGLSFNFNLLGDGLVVMAIVSYSFSVVTINVLAKNEDPIALSGYQMTLGGIVLLLVGIVLNGKIDIVKMLPIIIGLSAIYAVSYTLWTVLLKHNPASSVTIYSFVTPIFGVVFSALLLTEETGVDLVNLIIALGLVCFGIILWGYERKSVKPKTL